MKNLLLVSDSRFQEHKTPAGHPESPARLASIDKAILTSSVLSSLPRLEPRQSTVDELVLAHHPDYIERIENAALRAARSEGILSLDADTYMSPQSYEIAKLACGAGFVSVDACLKSDFNSLKTESISLQSDADHNSSTTKQNAFRHAFVAVRPPGHHALKAQSMGFCLFNNIALAARYAQKVYGKNKVLIIDWDVHHGNGTQEMFFDDPSVLFISMHQYPFWPPGIGWLDEVGRGDGKGFNVNIPLSAGTGDRGYLKCWDEIIEPIALQFQPDLILVSAGYDAHEADPLAEQCITTQGFGQLSRRLKKLSDSLGVASVCFLEGGYNVDALAESVVTTARVLNTSPAETDEIAGIIADEFGMKASPLSRDIDDGLTDERISEIWAVQSKYWKKG